MADTAALRSLEAELQKTIFEVKAKLEAVGEGELGKSLRKSADELMLQARSAVEWSVSAASAEEIATAEAIADRCELQGREATRLLQSALAGPEDQLRAEAGKAQVLLHSEAQSSRSLRKPGQGGKFRGSAAATDWGAVGQSIGFAVIALVIIGGIGFGLFGDRPIKVEEDNFARGLITFLVTITAVAIAIILTLAATVSRADELEKRISLGKELLTALIGVLGTIVGFYFGKSSSAAPTTPVPTPPPATVAPAMPNSGGTTAAKPGATGGGGQAPSPAGNNSP